jgi:P27 family predicted phage terminase small subunit
VSLKLIADNYAIYLEAKKDIDANGIIRTDNQGRDFKNQAVSVMNVAQRNIVDLLKQFSLTPMSKSKMKNLDKGDLQKSPLDEFLSDD